MTTELAPITQRSPIVTPLVTTQLTPNQQLEPIPTGPLEVKPCRVIGVSGSSKRWAVADEAAVGEHRVIADLDPLERREHRVAVEEAAGADLDPGLGGQRSASSQDPANVPSPIRQPPIVEAPEPLPSTGWRMKKPPRAAWRAIRQRRSGRRLRSYQRPLRGAKLAIHSAPRRAHKQQHYETTADGPKTVPMTRFRPVGSITAAHG